MGAHLYDNRDDQTRELHVNGQVHAVAQWSWISAPHMKRRDKSDPLWMRWRPDHRFGHYPEPPLDAVAMSSFELPE